MLHNIKNFKSQIGYNRSYFGLNRRTINNLDNFHEKDVVIYHHLGLGDHIICNGLVNFISESYNVHLAVKKNNYNNVNYLYSSNDSVKIFKVNNNEYRDVYSYAKKNNFKVLKIGFNNQINDKGNYWNVSFYTQLNLDYDFSYDYFFLPQSDKMQKRLEVHLKNFYKIKDRYALVHNESSKQKFNLNISNPNIIEVTKDSDIFNNIFLYEILIKNAEEIHCINSSFIHLVERIKTNASLNYHKLWDSNFKLSSKWKVLNYGD